MYKVNHVMRLDGPQFYEISVWNMFCRKKILTAVILGIFAFGLFTVATAIPALKNGNINGFILNGGIGLVVAIMSFYLIWNNVSRLKRTAANEEHLAKTEKHIKMDEDQIINYRASVGEQIVYKWAQVEGMYDRKGEIVLSMKDRQILVLDKARLSEDEISFLKAKGDVLQLWKKDFPMTVWYVLAAAAVVAAVIIGVAGYLR